MQANATKQFEIGFDDFFSESTRAHIKDYVAGNPLFKTLSCSQIIAAIVQQFPCIAHATAVKKPDGTLTINLMSSKPWRIINGELILCESGAIFPSEIFDYAYVKNLPAVEVASHDPAAAQINQSCQKFLESLSPKVCKQFDIAWLSETKSILRDKQQPLFSVMVNNDQGLTDELLVACDRIKQDLHGKGLFKGARARQWFADLRFEHQIVVYAQKRGEQ